MADSTGGKKSTGKKAPGKKPPGTQEPEKAAGTSKGSGGKTIKLAQKLALEVIREYGLPEEIKEELRKILEAHDDINPDIVERVGGYFDDHPHGAWGYTRKHKPKKKK